ncbi:MAG: DNA primase, partial [Planctomycetota bacterium]|nr:DNA primase [Planctomycetota bacterium]
MSRIPDHIIDQVRDAHDIVDIVQRAVPLKKAGAAYKGLCPFHDEKTPSFTVHPGRQTYKCFGCGKGGNVFGFLMETQGLAFPEAVRRLAEERGIVLPDEPRSDPAEDERLDRVRRALAFAHKFFASTLASDAGREARSYLERRGYDTAAQQQFGLGYAPAAWDRLLEAAVAAGLTPQDLDDAGLVVPRRESDGFYDRYRNRVMFPIADGRARLCTFAGRTLDPDEQAKYINGPETIAFRKSDVLYALHRARDTIRRRGESLLMEGYTDVLMCHMHGFENAVAGMGTAFTERQARLLARAAERVVLVYDGDDAGRAAAEKSLDVLLQHGLEVRVALLPEGRDVDEILIEEGPEAFQAVLDASLELFEFKLAAAGRRHDLDTPRGRAQAMEEIVASVVKVQSELERDQLLRMLADRLGGGPETETVLRRRA